MGSVNRYNAINAQVVAVKDQHVSSNNGTVPEKTGTVFAWSVAGIRGLVRNLCGERGDDSHVSEKPDDETAGLRNIQHRTKSDELKFVSYQDTDRRRYNAISDNDDSVEWLEVNVSGKLKNTKRLGKVDSVMSVIGHPMNKAPGSKAKESSEIISPAASAA